MELEVGKSVAGFLGVHIETNELDLTVKLTQKGLTKRIVEALQIEHLRPKQTPEAREALVADKEGKAAD